jgi:hypothetical protein
MNNSSGEEALILEINLYIEVQSTQNFVLYGAKAPKASFR